MSYKSEKATKTSRTPSGEKSSTGPRTVTRASPSGSKDSMQSVTVYLGQGPLIREWVTGVKKLARSKGKSLTDFVTDAIYAAIQKEEKRNANRTGR